MKTFVFLICVIIFTSCQKELSLDKDIAADTLVFKQLLTATDKKFRVVEFYSDMPIDFDDTDTITTKEVNLWKYLSIYLRDDSNVFLQDGTLQVYQNIEKIPGDNSVLLLRSYKIETVDNKVMFDFLDYNYNPYRYFLHEKGTDYFILYTVRDSDKAKLFSKFVVVE